jgi:hypothetical protein
MTKQFYFLFFCLVFFGTTVRAQLQKGTFLLGGDPITTEFSGGLGSLDIINEAALYSFSPRLGYFITDRFVLQGGVGITGLSVEGEGFNIFTAGAGARFYLNPTHPKNNFFLEAQPNWTSTSFLGESFRKFGYNIGVGSTGFLAPGASFDTRLSFSSFFPDEDNFSETRNLTLSTSLNFYLNPEMKAGRKSAVPALQKGQWMIGGSSGSFGFSFNPDALDITLTPTVGYFVSNRFVAGARLGMSLQRLEGTSGEKAKVSVITLAPTARYYFGPNTRLRWFAGTSVALNYSSVDDGTFEVSDNTFSWGLNAGFNHFLTPNFAWELGPYFNINSDDFSGGVGVGFNYFIR